MWFVTSLPRFPTAETQLPNNRVPLYPLDGDDFTLFPWEFWILWPQDRRIWKFYSIFEKIAQKWFVFVISKDLGHHNPTQSTRDPLSEHGLFFFKGRKSRQTSKCAFQITCTGTWASPCSNRSIPSLRPQAVAYDIQTGNRLSVKHESNAIQSQSKTHGRLTTRQSCIK